MSVMQTFLAFAVLVLSVAVLVLATHSHSLAPAGTSQRPILALDGPMEIFDEAGVLLATGRLNSDGRGCLRVVADGRAHLSRYTIDDSRYRAGPIVCDVVTYGEVTQAPSTVRLSTDSLRAGGTVTITDMNLTFGDV